MIRELRGRVGEYVAGKENLWIALALWQSIRAGTGQRCDDAAPARACQASDGQDTAGKQILNVTVMAPDVALPVLPTVMLRVAPNSPWLKFDGEVS